MTAISSSNLQGTAGPLVLVIDDDLTITELLEIVLEDEGCQVAIAHCSDEAWACIRKRRPDLILLDLMIPEVDGFQIGEQLHRNPSTSSIPVVVLSASRGIQRWADIEKIGAVDYLDKPFDVNALGERLQAWLGAPKANFA